MSGDHWCRWEITMDLGQIFEALQILFLWLSRLGYQWLQTVVFPLGVSRTNAPKFNDPKFIAPKLNVPNPPKLNALNLMFGT